MGQRHAGPIPRLGVAEARLKAVDYRRSPRQGIDPRLKVTEAAPFGNALTYATSSISTSKNTPSNVIEHGIKPRPSSRDPAHPCSTSRSRTSRRNTSTTCWIVQGGRTSRESNPRLQLAQDDVQMGVEARPRFASIMEGVDFKPTKLVRERVYSDDEIKAIWEAANRSIRCRVPTSSCSYCWHLE